jgi:gamma-glutamyltranspeptidase/glutathione hydrolase
LSAFADHLQLSKHAARGRHGVVAAQNLKAATVGAEVLKAGGHAIDAAVATSLALAATEPWMSGLGGGSTMLILDRATGEVESIDAGMIAPAALDPAAYPLVGGTAGDLFAWPAVVEDRNVLGPLSFAVPGHLAGLGLAHERQGRMTFAELVGPARQLAKDGLEIDWYAALLVGTAARDLRRFPSSAEVWLADGLPPTPAVAGEPLKLPLGRLAETLDLLAEEGPKTLYTGGLAELVAADAAALGSPLAAADLAAYRASVAPALRIPYGEAEVFGMPGLFAGSTLRRCLEALAGWSLASDSPGRDAYLAFAEVLKGAYAKRLAEDGHASDGPAPSCTSHLSVIDAEGNMVALTQTLLSLFGSRVVLPSTGMLMNNGVMWFDPRPGRPNSIAPGVRPLSNMCPVIATDATRRLALGASGGRRILPAVLQLLSFILDNHMSLEEAFAEPRIDVSGDELVTMSRDLDEEVRAALAEAHGATTVRAEVYPMRFACPVAVLHDLLLDDRYGTAEVIHPWADAVAVQ